MNLESIKELIEALGEGSEITIKKEGGSFSVVASSGSGESEPEGSTGPIGGVPDDGAVGTTLP